MNGTELFKLIKQSSTFDELLQFINFKTKTETQWHNVIAWGKTAEIIEKYVTKGKEVAIEGKLTNRSWEDKEGVKRYTTEVVCNELLMLGNK